MGCLLQIRMSSKYVAKYLQYDYLSTIHKSGSRLVILKSSFNNDFTKYSWNLAAEVFNPNNDLLMITFFPQKSSPNSGPAVM
jgi:hypothetical protein